MKRRFKFSTALLVLAAFSAIVIYLVLTSSGIPDLATDGYVEAGVLVENDSLILISGCDSLSMEISEEQAISIQMGLNSFMAKRPNAHDLMRDLLRELDAKILMVKIVDIRDGAYLARLIVGKDRDVLNFDSRPSDAIAVASRVEYLVPVYVNSTLMENYSEAIC